MTPSLLEKIGVALYGPRWQADLARDLGVAPRSVQRWLTGDRGIPDLRQELIDLINQRSTELDHLITELKS